VTLSLRVESLRIRGFRNIVALDLPLVPNINVISGDNGQGKTSVLEALYLLATTRSFRTEKPLEACNAGVPTTRVEGSFNDGIAPRTQRYVVHDGKRGFFVEDKRVSKFSTYAVQTPVVVFHPGDLTLVSGGASERRTLLDRIAFFLDPAVAEERVKYTKAQRARQALLERRGSPTELGVFETLMSQSGSYLSRMRETAARALRDELLPTFASVSPRSLAIHVTYQPGGTTDPGHFQHELQTRRGRDLQRGTATFGPHRDDLELLLDERTARKHASQGQQRLLTLAIKVAELACVRNARRIHPLLLLDDVSSELDPERTGAVYDVVRSAPSQVLVTTTRPELFDTSSLSPGIRADFRLSDGKLVARV
jgi:DNA replication and repair protein RecF